MNPWDVVNDLAITKSGPDTVLPGDTITYDLSISNTGLMAFTNVTLTDTLPSEVSFVSDSLSICSAAGGYLTCPIGTLAGGATTNLQIVTQTDPSTCYTAPLANRVEVTADQPESDTANNSAWWSTTVLHQADLQISKSVDPDPVTAGETVDFILEITNNGPGCAWDVSATDELGYAENPDGIVMLDFDAPYSTQGPGPLDDYWYTCSSGGACTRALPMPPGSSDILTMTLQIPAGTPSGAYTNYAGLVWDSGNDITSTDYEVSAQANLLVAAAALPDPVTAGGSLFYEISVTNTGPSIAPATVIETTLPAGLSFAGGPPGCSAAGQTVTCNLGDLGVGIPRSVLIAASVSSGLPDGAVMDHQACVVSTGNPADPLPQCASGQVHVVQSPLNPTDLLLEKDVIDVFPTGTLYSGDPSIDGFAVAGGTIGYEIIVTNMGVTTATDVVIYDQLPYRFTLVESFFDVSYSSDDPMLCTPGGTCILGSVPPGGVASIYLDVRVEPDAPLSPFMPFPFYNQAAVQAANPDPDPSNNWDLTAVTVEPLVDLEIIKTSQPETVIPGQELTYEIEVFNAGPSDLGWDIRQFDYGLFDIGLITDTLPLELDPSTLVIDYDGNSSLCNRLDRILDCFVGIPALHASRITIRGQVYPWVTEPFTNTAWGYDLFETTNVSSTAVTTVSPIADLSLTKTGPTQAYPDEILTYQVNVHNNGPSDAYNVQVTDALPAGLTPETPTVFTIAHLQAGETAAFTVQARSDPTACLTGPVVNQAEVTAATPDPDPINNSASWSTNLLGQADLIITKSANPDPVTAGEEVNFTITITNNGPGCAADVSVTDEPGYSGNPPGMTMLEFDSSNSTQGAGPLNGNWYTCSGGGACTRALPMPPGTSDILTMTFKLPPETEVGSYTNSAGLVWDSGQGQARVRYDVTAEADLSIATAAMPNLVAAGGTLLHQVTVTNHGPSIAPDTVIDLTLPTGLSFAGGSPGCSAAGQVVTCLLGDLGPNHPSSVFISAAVDSALVSSTVLEHTACVVSTGNPADDLPRCASGQAQVAQSSIDPTDLILTQSGPAYARTGDLVTFAIQVTNAGPATARSVVIFDELPQGLSLVSSTLSQSGNPTLPCQGMVCQVDEIAPGEVVIMTVTGQVEASLGIDQSLVNRTTVFSSSPEITQDNNTAELTLLINRSTITLYLPVAFQQSSFWQIRR